MGAILSPIHQQALYASYPPGFIVEYLERRFGCNPNASLSAAERGVALSLRRLFEENLYWTLVFDRWMVDANWPLTQQTVLGLIPAPARLLIAPIARRGVKRQLMGHGIGLHSPDEIRAIAAKDIGAVADFLGDKPHLMGEAPTEIDATAYGLLANIMLVPIASATKDVANGRKNLVDYVERIRARYFD